MHDHLCLQRWPFMVVPDPVVCDFIADREIFREDIEKLLRGLSRQSASSIHPIWSWFGSGKTHTLYYFSNRAAEIDKQVNGHFKTTYSEFPINPRSFLDVYRSVSIGLDRDMLGEIYLEIATSPEAVRLERDLRSISADLASAMRVLLHGPLSAQDLVMCWLRAEPLPVSDCRKLGISKKIASSEDSSRILTGIIRMFGLSGGSRSQMNSRLTWLFDEFQRIDQLAPRVRDEINAGLHSIFNACPTSFSLILSFSGHPGETLPGWFSPELRDRIGGTKVMILPPMQTDDALKFIRDILASSRPDEITDVDPYFPFSERTCRTVIEYIKERGELKPRRIMQAFHAILQEADPQIEGKEIDVVSPDLAKGVLAEVVQGDS